MSCFCLQLTIVFKKSIDQNENWKMHMNDFCLCALSISRHGIGICQSGMMCSVFVFALYCALRLEFLFPLLD